MKSHPVHLLFLSNENNLFPRFPTVLCYQIVGMFLPQEERIATAISNENAPPAPQTALTGARRRGSKRRRATRYLQATRFDAPTPPDRWDVLRSR